MLRKRKGQFDVFGSEVITKSKGRNQHHKMFMYFGKKVLHEDVMSMVNDVLKKKNAKFRFVQVTGATCKEVSLYVVVDC